MGQRKLEVRGKMGGKTWIRISVKIRTCTREMPSRC